MKKGVVSRGPGDLVAQVMEERGVSGNSRDYVLFYADGTVIDRHGRTTRFTGEIAEIHKAGGPNKVRLVHKRNLWAYTDHTFAKQFWRLWGPR